MRLLIVSRLLIDSRMSYSWMSIEDYFIRDHRALTRNLYSLNSNVLAVFGRLTDSPIQEKSRSGSCCNTGHSVK